MRCFHCMKELQTPANFCPFCGNPTAEQNPLHHLTAGTVLNKRYLVGNPLGEGGFGITYVGLDRVLKIKVAVKEYYPSSCANRTHTQSNDVSPGFGSQKEFYNNGMERFLQEAQSVARFSKERGIVDVRDFFTENNTAYMVMEYIDGETLFHHLRKHGTMEPAKLIDRLLPLMRSLEKMHAENIIHRDISPDNIMIENDGTLKLLDFGAARYFSDDGIKTMSVILKQGYAPYEQYSKKGRQGPWTDVYALCATIYKCITGKTPPDSLDRAVEDELKKPSELGVVISPQQEDALMRGLAIQPKDRLQSMGELIEALTAKAQPKPEPTPKPIDPVIVPPPVGNDKTVAADKPEEKPADEDKTVAANAPVDENKTVAADEPIDVNKTIAADAPVISEPPKLDKPQQEKKKKSKKAIAIAAVAVVLVAAIVTGVIFIFSPKNNTPALNENNQQESTELSEASNTEEASLTPAELKTIRESLPAHTIDSGEYHTVGLKSDGTVVATGESGDGQCDVSGWKDIVAVSAGDFHTVGLKADGTVVATGWNKYGQCDVSGWKDIVAVSAGYTYTVGLKSDGTVVATGSNVNGRCNVSGWKDIVAVSAGSWHTVGLKSDETVVATRDNNDGRCDVSDWKDIVAVSAGYDHTVGLKADGTVVATGNNVNGRCNVSGWKDIVAVSAGSWHTVGLKSDGTVVATRDNNDGRCDVSDWKDIVAVSAGYDYTVGLKADGTVVATGDNSNGQCDVSGWKNIKTK